MEPGMKKIAVLVLAAGMLFALSEGASAIDFSAKGRWAYNFSYGQHGNFTAGGGRTGYSATEDEFEAAQQVRLQLDAKASENLSGTVHFEIGGYNRGMMQYWGASGNGGALGADGTVVKVKNAFLDWVVPQTALKVRMGIQPIQLPDFINNSQVLADDAAGITASYAFNENVGITAFWTRLFNDNSTATTNRSPGYMDNFDAVGLTLPLTFNGVNLTPWGMYAGIGPALNYNNVTGNPAQRQITTYSSQAAAGGPRAGMLPLYGGFHKKRLTEYGNAMWVGMPGQVTVFDPFRISWDVVCGAVQYDDSAMNRAGWLASLLLEYKLDWSTPGLYGWYTSGDDDNLGNGSERMPNIHPNNPNDFSEFAFHGDPIVGRDSIVGKSMTGTWGIGVRLKDMSFIENLSHTFRINYMGGTNDPGILKKINRATGSWMAPNDNSVAGREGLYLTRNDSLLEFGLSTKYKMYDNFTVYVETNYDALFLDKSASVWGNSKMNGKSDRSADAWNTAVTFVYQF